LPDCIACAKSGRRLSLLNTATRFDELFGDLCEKHYKELGDGNDDP